MAQTFKYGNGVWATKEGSSLAFNDQDGHYKPLPFTTTRASSATRVNKQGLIEVVGNDRARIDYSETSKGALLLEPARTNVNTYSEDGSEWDWIQGAISLDSSAVAPDGSSGVYKFTDNTVDGQHRVTIRGQVTDTLEYTFSSFVKLSEGSDITKIYLLFATGFDSERYYFDLENGTTLDAQNTGHSIEDYGNGWYRVIATSTATSTANAFFGVNLTDGNNTYEGTGNGSMLVWGVQVEQGSYATSYIPTSGSTATRQADTASDAGVANVFNDSEGVLYANIKTFEYPISLNNWMSINDGSASNSIAILFETTSTIVVRCDAGGTNQSFLSYNTNYTDYKKVAFKYKANDFALWIDGFEINTDSSGNVPTGLSEFDFNYGAGTNNFYGKTKQIGVYDTALTDAELEYLTSYRSWEEMVTELNLTIK